jgi:Tol biopolymer transport system component
MDHANDVWIYERERGALTRLTFDPGEEETPVWSPDGRWIAFATSRAGQPRSIYRKAADGSGAEERLWSGDFHAHVSGWAPDGQTIVMEIQGAETSTDIWLLDGEGERAARPLLQTRFNERTARLSPDGRWLAYVSDESGRDEVYVQPFPDLAGKWQISIQGGNQPVWSRDGRELFYRGGEQLMAVTVSTEPPFRATAPQALFPDAFERPQGPAHTSYDVAPDGRFLMLQSSQVSRETERTGSTQLHVVQNWFEELKRLVPTN